MSDGSREGVRLNEGEKKKANFIIGVIMLRMNSRWKQDFEIWKGISPERISQGGDETNNFPSFQMGGDSSSHRCRLRCRRCRHLYRHQCCYRHVSVSYLLSCLSIVVVDPLTRSVCSTRWLVKRGGQPI